MAQRKIDFFFDCVSPYSYFAFEYLLKNRKALRSHGVEIEFHPMYLGGIMGGSGNRPPWVVENKAKYLSYDNVRGRKYYGTPNMRRPDVFPVQSLLPQRCLYYIKENYPGDRYEKAMREMWIGLWEQNSDISNPELLKEILSRNFSEQETTEILEAGETAQYKDKLSANTTKALEQGAFGAPWFWVTNDQGQEQPFFGSDRFGFMWEFLGLPWEDIKIQERL